MSADNRLRPTRGDRLEDHLRRQFQHVLWLGSRDVDSSKWYAEELAKIAVSEIREAEARARALAGQRDRCIEHLRAALGYVEGDRDAGLESLCVQVKTRVLPPAPTEEATDDDRA